ncbi:hypothetical protein SSZBM1_83 [Synechococcus phage S-SZBM1]|uniref:Uncharacterized protein n=1 Tax=Synechococcus phage S-SZBM1 TaxID=2926475 RepID=A0AC61TSI3_9CAUD|nr:hypothetical protein PP650_gp193 [Synechococcus phage S-SZBM1]UNH61200.1 hypothetical protein SSZBM1_83 [Synechococcus phage S-SZBM1]
MSSVYTLNIKDARKKMKSTSEVQTPEVDDSEKIGEQIVYTIAGLLLGPLVVWVAWNMCIPALFGLPAIGYLKSLALYCLIKILK